MRQEATQEVGHVLLKHVHEYGDSRFNGGGNVPVPEKRCVDGTEIADSTFVSATRTLPPHRNGGGNVPVPEKRCADGIEIADSTFSAARTLPPHRNGGGSVPAPENPVCEQQ
jgi:hypothetical protein